MSSRSGSEERSRSQHELSRGVLRDTIVYGCIFDCERRSRSSRKDSITSGREPNVYGPGSGEIGEGVMGREGAIWSCVSMKLSECKIRDRFAMRDVMAIRRIVDFRSSGGAGLSPAGRTLPWIALLT